MANEVAFREEYVYIEYDDIIRSYVPTLYNHIMKPEVKEFWENTDFTELRGERQVWVKTDFSDFNSSEYSNYSNNSVWSRNTGSGGWGR